MILTFSFTSCELIEFIEFIDYIYDTSSSTSSNDTKPTVVPDSDTIEYIQYKALEYAKMYCDEDTVYVYGAQDPIRALRVDCSGMVINCYKYAIKNTKYKLLFDDTTAANMYSKYSIHTTTPQPGDLIFMGDANSSAINHIGIFEKKVGSTIYFIDATEGKGVSQRNYAQNNSKIKGYGQMKFTTQ